MMKARKYMKFGFALLMRRFFRTRIRTGTIQATKYYVQSVAYLRLMLIGIFGIGALVSVLVTGLILLVIGVGGLVPMNPHTFAVTLVVIGALMAALSGIAMILILSQRRWLEASRSYDLIDAALARWPGVMPPNPIEVVKRAREREKEDSVRQTEKQRLSDPMTVPFVP